MYYSIYSFEQLYVHLIGRARRRAAARRHATRPRADRHHYKQAETRTLTLHTFFKFVWGSGWGVKKNLCRVVAAINSDFARPDDPVDEIPWGLSRPDSSRQTLQHCRFGRACIARGGGMCKFQKITAKITADLRCLLPKYRSPPRARGARSRTRLSAPVYIVNIRGRRPESRGLHDRSMSSMAVTCVCA